ncbi:MAG: hypothetical protein CSB21_03755, partial [Deltaproteobacteria bacterium]
TMDSELVDAYEAHMKWKRDYASGVDDALARGLRQGREEGREEGKKEGREQGIEEGFLRSRIEIAKRMLDKGYELEVMREFTGMDVAELEKLSIS